MIVCRFIHGCHSGTIMLLAESLKVYFDGDWPYRRSEIEKSVAICAKPLSNISTIGHCG